MKGQTLQTNLLYTIYIKLSKKFWILLKEINYYDKINKNKLTFKFLKFKERVTCYCFNTLPSNKNINEKEKSIIYF